MDVGTVAACTGTQTPGRHEFDLGHPSHLGQPGPSVATHLGHLGHAPVMTHLGHTSATAHLSDHLGAEPRVRAPRNPQKSLRTHT